jgi:hypothetical protein
MRQRENLVQVQEGEAEKPQANLFLMHEFGVQQTKPSGPKKQQYPREISM